jgi:hypothetical protein
MNHDLFAASVPAVRFPEFFPLVLLWNTGCKRNGVLNTLDALQLGARSFEIGLLPAIYGLFTSGGPA